MEYEQGAENQSMDGNPSMRGPSESATHIARADRPHLSDPELGGTPKAGNSHWEAAVATILRTLSPMEQHDVALGFIVKEHRDAAAATTTTASSGTTPRVLSLKLHVSNYVGKEGECGVVISRRSLRPSASKDEATFKLFKLQTLGHVTESDLEVRETRLSHYRRLVGAP
ncbi:hypothetical protein PC116_g18401 [Phytophthora cactorum]|uniref:Uncharacterized protein n=1 Tax=Phytophthora cactorum TaxID=29920 RepID=A0A8T1CZ53_9STRA|nr:hypothetical protein Pcac1_g8651 [Phytophthora cactorum]KAG2817469.1 hypothetical protein PC112_g13043 [Phytophthora cactorum]KAG2819366.1 hypothetical protein PC111_g11932 [Phytophthora cactorum]KAG2864888.1 hypothetical protein PC113_g4214 [Phytophthora cactorum]KAG2898883.1 hypothetical protein PC114_g14122 [Phytophthora cactorum]